MSKPLFQKIGVLGAGNMGSRIAAHFANAGVPVVLLDLTSSAVLSALESLKKAKPQALFGPELVQLIQAGSFDADTELLTDCDWIIEAVTENLDIKRALLRKIDSVRKARTIITTNTSGLPVTQIAEGMSGDFRRHWFGAHFFNPPRYMRLLELISTEETDPDALEAVAEFADKRLGKTVVRAKDKPNFIGNRIGTFGLLNTMRIMQRMEFTIEQVDALTGSVIGWPKTGTFRLSDLIGIDVLVHVANNFFNRVSDERSDVSIPVFMTEMVSRNWVGDKAGQGFFTNQNQRLGLDWKTLEYRPSENVTLPVLEEAKRKGTLESRLKFLLGPEVRDAQVSAFYRQIFYDIWNYSANRIPEICDDIVAIDTAMKAGFNWEMGPFEMWDAVGVPGTAEQIRAGGTRLAPALEKLLAQGFTSWYKDDPATPSGRLFFDVLTGDYKPVTLPEGVRSAATFRTANRVVRESTGASLIDLGDGIACLEFHTKMNAINRVVSSFVAEILEPGSRAVFQFRAFVIASDAPNFSAGADLTEFLQAIQSKKWDDLKAIIGDFQNLTECIRFCPRPVVAAPCGLCLGGGAEVALHAAARQAHAELTMGLVEAAVGLVPGGGGCKEMAVRAAESENPEISLRRYFENIATARTSRSAHEARMLSFLSKTDEITMNRDRLLMDAKAKAQAIADEGYSAQVPRKNIPAAGRDMLLSLKSHVKTMRETESISDHDVTVRNHIAHILCGGNIEPGTLVSEQYFLDLERESFLSLCGEKKTEERIAFTLRTGKPLRN